MRYHMFVPNASYIGSPDWVIIIFERTFVRIDLEGTNTFAEPLHSDTLERFSGYSQILKFVSE